MSNYSDEVMTIDELAIILKTLRFELVSFRDAHKLVEKLQAYKLGCRVDEKARLEATEGK